MKISPAFNSMAAAGLLLLAANTAQADSITSAAVIENYANIAQAGYQDALSTAKNLQQTVQRLIAEPSEEALDNARSAWTSARAPYQQTEVYRFGNVIVDDWEGKVNAWPLDEGLIDYVHTRMLQDRLLAKLPD